MLSFTATVSSLTRASYTAQFTDWSAAALPTLDTKFNQLYRRLSRNMATFPTRLLYLPATSGGLGLPRLSTYVNMRKWSMAQRALTHEHNTNTAHAVAGMLDRAARYSGCPTDTGGPVSIGYTSRAPAWVTILGAPPLSDSRKAPTSPLWTARSLCFSSAANVVECYNSSPTAV